MRGVLARIRTWGDGIAVIDVVIAGALVVAALADTLTTSAYDEGTPRLVVSALLQTAPLVWRRSRTLLAASLGALGLGIEVAGTEPYGGVYGMVAFLLLIHATARWTSSDEQRRTVAVLVFGAALFWTAELSQGDVSSSLRDLPFVVVAVTLAWTTGSLGGRSARHVAEAAEQRAAAAEQERRAMARELHDVLGHALAGISLTAGSAKLDAREAETADHLEAIRQMSSHAAADVRRLVGLLREDTDDGPQPSLADLPDLVERARGAGIQVDHRTTGAVRAATAGVELSAFRIIQEALTNASKHAPGAPVHLHVRHDPDSVLLTISNPCPAPEDSSGYGLVGLAERVAVHDGEFSAGWDDGQFRVTARLPRS